MEYANESVQNGIFSNPPKNSDLEKLDWENDDFEKIRDCDPKKCTARLPGGTVTLIQKEVDWKSKTGL